MRFAGLTTAVSTLLVFGLLLVPSAALAGELHPFLEIFGSANQPSFGSPEGLAVDQSSGDLLVISASADTVSRWKPNGEAHPFSALGTNVIDGKGTGNCATVPSDCDETPELGLALGGPGEVQVAVDNSGGSTDGNIYVTHSSSPRAIQIFASDGHYLGHLTGSTEGTFAEPCGVAVDPSGNVYVGDYGSGGHVHKFVPTANPPVNADNTANFSYAQVCTLAAGAGATAGFVFPAHFFGSVAKLDSASGAQKYDVSSGSNTTETVDPASGHLYIASGTAVVEYDASGATEAKLLSSFSPGGTVNGIAVNGTTGNVYVARSGSSKIEVWGPLSPALPLVLKKGSGAGQGTVQSTPAGINCGPACTQGSAEFVEGAVVQLQVSPATGSEFNGWSTIAGNPGTCTGTTSPCQVTMSEAVELKANFVVGPPIVTALTPSKGPLTGGNQVEITGVSLAGATKVEFGSTVVNAPFTENTATRIRLNAPAHAAGTVDVSVTTAVGSSSNTAADDYTYVAPPAVTALSPSKGPTSGDQVEITGVNLGAATKVEFGSTVVNSFIENTATTIKVNVPGHAGGTVDVIVTTAGGPSPNTAADDYTYVAPPAVTALSPAKGPIDGGNQIEIIGLRLGAATQVEFGDTVISAPFIENTATTITLDAPAHPVGTVNVRVTTPGGTSRNFSNDDYTFEVPTHVLSVAKAGAGSGTVSSSPAGINCGLECQHAYSEGTVVTLHATPAAGSTFSGWSGGSCSGTGSCVVTILAARSVTATFDANPPPPPPPGAEERPLPRKCKRGFRKAKRHGRVVCIKKHAHKRRKRG